MTIDDLIFSIRNKNQSSHKNIACCLNNISENENKQKNGHAINEYNVDLKEYPYENS